MDLVPHSRPWIADDDLAAVAAVLRSERLATGETRSRFERAVADWLAVDAPGVAVGSGRAALHVALRALGIGPGGEVIIPSYACASLLASVAATGATAVPCDAGQGWLMTPDAVADRLTARTRAIVVVHLYGFFADTAAFTRFGAPIIEDFAQAVPGAGERGLEGDFGICSFHPTKCLTTGEGGMVLARVPDLAARVRAMVLAPMSDVAAALGLAQLARYPDALRRRGMIAARYREALARACAAALVRQPQARAVHFRFPVSLPGGVDACQAAFARHGVTVRRGVDHLAHRALGLPDARFPRSVELLETTVSLPIYPALVDADVRRCVEAAAAICAQVCGTGAEIA